MGLRSGRSDSPTRSCRQNERMNRRLLVIAIANSEKVAVFSSVATS
jgi:hypothetical protein